MVQDSTVNERNLFAVLKWLRDLRARAIKHKIDPWAFRQALVMILELDTVAALGRGVTAETLAAFDATVRGDSREWVRRRG